MSALEKGTEVIKDALIASVPFFHFECGPAAENNLTTQGRQQDLSGNPEISTGLGKYARGTP